MYNWKCLVMVQRRHAVISLGLDISYIDVGENLWETDTVIVSLFVPSRTLLSRQTSFIHQLSDTLLYLSQVCRVCDICSCCYLFCLHFVRVECRSVLFVTRRGTGWSRLSSASCGRRPRRLGQRRLASLTRSAILCSWLVDKLVVISLFVLW